MRDPRASILDNDPFTKKNEGVRPFNPRKGPKNVSETPIFQRFWEISMNQPAVCDACELKYTYLHGFESPRGAHLRSISAEVSYCQW